MGSRAKTVAADRDIQTLQPYTHINENKLYDQLR